MREFAEVAEKVAEAAHGGLQVWWTREKLQQEVMEALRVDVLRKCRRHRSVGPHRPFDLVGEMQRSGSVVL